MVLHVKLGNYKLTFNLYFDRSPQNSTIHVDKQIMCDEQRHCSQINETL